jgi:hypothetical protein
MREAKHAALTGRAGEYAVAAQILLRDMAILWPAVDMGCDLMAENGCRIQVKCAHFYNHPDGARYHFPLPKTRRLPNTDKTTKLVTRKTFAEICDYVVFWGIEQNRFWVVPAAVADSCTGVDLGIESSQRRFVGSVADMREMKALGYSNYKISKHYGIQQCSVKQFLDSGKDIIDETTVSRMRACEGRWDFILEFKRSTLPLESPIASEQVGGIGQQGEGPKE